MESLYITYNLAESKLFYFLTFYYRRNYFNYMPLDLSQYVQMIYLLNMTRKTLDMIKACHTLKHKIYNEIVFNIFASIIILQYIEKN